MRRFRYDPDLDQIVEIFDHNRVRVNAGPHVMPDLDRVYNGGFRSPIDGEHITSRSQLRAHEVKHGVRQAGDFKPGEIISAERKRVAASMPRSNDGVSFEWI